MSERDALFAAILAHPDEDTPRLMYADYLQDQGGPGDGERAEFIRVQLEHARLDQVDRICPFIKEYSRPDPGPEPVERWREGVCQCRGCVLVRRERELLAGPRPDVFENEVIWFNEGDGTDNWRLLFRPRWVRGFVGEVTASGRDWGDHADTILAANPVRKVRLTSWTWGLYIHRDNPDGPFWAVETPAEAVAYCERNWPGVKFEWPPPETYGPSPFRAALDAIVTAQSLGMGLPASVMRQAMGLPTPPEPEGITHTTT